MEKKLVLVLFMVALIAGGAFAEDKLMSAGVGFYGAYETQTATASYNGISATETDNTLYYGAYGFFDIKYAEVSVNFIYNDVDFLGSKLTYNSLGFGLIGKYPFAVSDAIAIFPFVGINYQMLLNADWEGSTWDIRNKEDYARLYILLGVGVDFNLTDAIYLRVNAGYGIGLNNKRENDLISSAKPVETTLFTGQVPFKLAVGFRF